MMKQRSFSILPLQEIYDTVGYVPVHLEKMASRSSAMLASPSTSKFGRGSPARAPSRLLHSPLVINPDYVLLLYPHTSVLNSPAYPFSSPSPLPPLLRSVSLPLTSCSPPPPPPPLPLPLPLPLPSPSANLQAHYGGGREVSLHHSPHARDQSSLLRAARDQIPFHNHRYPGMVPRLHPCCPQPTTRPFFPLLHQVSQSAHSLLAHTHTHI